jgi:hypothetical protein
MSTYTIEGNLNFQDELLKLLNEDSDDEDDTNLCQITGIPLTDTHITLECNHHFNYAPLFNEIYNQKFIFKSYAPSTLSNKELEKFIEVKPDYYIRCPYCRNIQYSLLPYYEELGLEVIKGINSSVKEPNSKGIYELWAMHHTFNMYGATFTPGKCDICVKPSYVATIPNTKLTYCQKHYKTELKLFKDNCKIQANLKKQAKIDEVNKKKELLETINAERIAKGIPPLKKLPKQVISAKSEPNESAIEPSEIGLCKSILKSGPNKGQQCRCKLIYSDGLCKRHFTCL